MAITSLVFGIQSYKGYPHLSNLFPQAQPQFLSLFYDAVFQSSLYHIPYSHPDDVYYKSGWNIDPISKTNVANPKKARFLSTLAAKAYVPTYYVVRLLISGISNLRHCILGHVFVNSLVAYGSYKPQNSFLPGCLNSYLTGSKFFSSQTFAMISSRRTLRLTLHT